MGFQLLIFNLCAFFICWKIFANFVKTFNWLSFSFCCIFTQKLCKLILCRIFSVKSLMDNLFHSFNRQPTIYYLVEDHNISFFFDQVVKFMRRIKVVLFKFGVSKNVYEFGVVGCDQIDQLFLGTRFKNSYHNFFGDCPSDIIIDALIQTPILKIWKKSWACIYKLLFGQSIYLLGHNYV